MYAPSRAEAGSTGVCDGESQACVSIVKNCGRLVRMTVADRLTVMATGAAVAVSIVGGSCSTNARIDDMLRLDMRAEHDRIRADMRAEHDRIRADMGAEHATMRAEHDTIRMEIGQVDERVRVIEIKLGGQSGDTPPAGTRRQQ